MKSSPPAGPERFLSDEDLIKIRRKVARELRTADGIVALDLVNRCSGDFELKLNLERQLCNELLRDSTVNQAWNSILTDNFGEYGNVVSEAVTQFPLVQITLPPLPGSAVKSMEDLISYVRDNQRRQVLYYWNESGEKRCNWEMPDILYMRSTSEQNLVIVSVQFDLVKRVEPSHLKTLAKESFLNLAVSQTIGQT